MDPIEILKAFDRLSQQVLKLIDVVKALERRAQASGLKFEALRQSMEALNLPTIPDPPPAADPPRPNSDFACAVCFSPSVRILVGKRCPRCEKGIVVKHNLPPIPDPEDLPY